MTSPVSAAIRIVTGVALQHTGPIVVTILVCAAMLVVSPLTVVCAVVLTGTTWAACRGLEGIERRAVLIIMLAGIAIRVALVAGLFASAPAGPDVVSFPWDGDGRDVENRALMMRNIWLGVPVVPYQQYLAFTAYGWTSYIYVLGYLQFLLGPAPYAVHLVSVSCFMAGAAVMHRFMRRWYGPVPAILACGLIVFVPSLILWSAAAMRESFQFLGFALCIVALVQIACARGLPARLAGGAMLIGSVWMIDTIRERALTLVEATALVAMAGTFVTRRPYLLLAAVLVVPPAALYLLEYPTPSIEARLLDELRPMARRHRSSVNDQGHSYKVLDERFYWQEPVVEVVKTMTWDEARRYGMRAIAAVVFVPYPWQAWSRTEVLFVPQQMIWYALVCLALVGMVRGLRTAVFPTWVFMAFTVISLVGIAPIEGNIGTMVRHRDMVLPFVSSLAALGLVSLLARAGLWSTVSDVPDAPDAMLESPTAGERFLEGSAILRAIRGSAAYALVGRPSIGYQRTRYSLPHRRPVDDLYTWLAPSAIGRISLAMHKAASSTGSGSTVIASIAATVAELRALETWQRLRLAGLVCLASLLLAAPFGRGGAYGWPAQIVWAVSTLCAAIVMLAARPLGAAWRQKSQTSMRLSATPSLGATY